MTYRIQITVDGTTYPIARDVATAHPDPVHKAMGTGSEAELQMALDQCNVDDWYDRDGRYLGPDVHGLEIIRSAQTD